MASGKSNLESIARAAAEGVAIALAARSLRTRRPVKIICGIPPEIFEATIRPDRTGGYVVARVEAQGE
jgi:hypothetical protein